MFFVRIDDNKYIRKKDILSVETIKESNRIKTVVNCINDVSYIVFDAELKGIRLGNYSVDDIKTEITAECFKEIIVAECNYSENIGTTFRKWIENYINDIDSDSSGMIYIKNFEEEVQPIIDEAIESCCDDLDDTLG